MGSSKAGSDSGECGVGSIVWVRRCNGLWWPAKILGPEELTASHLTSSRSGTPVKLLGRDDANVDWYNLEKSKCVKAFRSGEFDDCVKRAEASLGMPTRKREKYAHREDAILHALELEEELLKKEGKLGVISESDRVSNSSGSVKKELVTSSGPLDIRSGHPGNSISNQFSERPETSIKDKNIVSPLNLRKPKDRNHPSLEDEHSEVIPRMRGLKDLGLRTAPPKRKLSSPCASDGYVKPTVDNNYRTPSSTPSMGGPTNGEQTGVLRAKRSRCIYLLAESGETLDHKEIPSSQTGMSHLQFEDGDCCPQTSFTVEESSSGFMEYDETDSSESESKFESQDDSSETEPDMDEETTLVSGASMPREVEFRTQALEEHGSTGSAEHDQLALSGDMSHPHPLDPISAYEAVSKWQLKGKRNIRHLTLKGKRNIRHLTKSSADGTNRRDNDGSIHGTYHEVKGAALKRSKLGQSLSFLRKDDFKEAVDEADFDDRDFYSQFNGLDDGYGYRLRAAPKVRNSFSWNTIDGDNMTWEDQPALRGHWGNKVEQFHPGYIGRYSFGGRSRYMLVDVDLKVQASYQKGIVPIVSLISKLNGNAIIGHPIQIEAIEDRSSECLIPANNYFDIGVVDHDRTLPLAWRTVRRTKFWVPRSLLSSSPNADVAAGSHSVLAEERRLPKKSDIGSFSYKESLVRKSQCHNSLPNVDRKSLKRLPKKVSSSSNQKTRTLSSIAIDRRLSYRALYDTSNCQVNGLIKLESSGPTTVACIPVKLIFSRLLEKINRPPSKVSSKVVLSSSDTERN